jgi:hypothetical protein
VSPRPVVDPDRCYVRHVRQRILSTFAGANESLSNFDVTATLLGKTFGALPLTPYNDERGWTSGSYEAQLNDEGTFEITFPNIVGSDGVKHVDRFLITRGDVNYRPGDEWFEFYLSPDGRPPGTVVFVGTPTKASITETSITLTGFDAFWLLNKVRDTTASFWNDSPHSVIQHYSRVWSLLAYDDFEATGRFTLSSTQQITADNQWLYKGADETTQYPGTVRVTAAPGNISYIGGSYLGSQTVVDGGWPNANAVGAADWRVDMDVLLGRLPSGAGISLEMRGNASQSDGVTDASVPKYGIIVYETFTEAFVNVPSNPSGSTLVARARQTRNTQTSETVLRLSIERRGQWVFFYINGQMIYNAVANEGGNGFRLRPWFEVGNLNVSAGAGAMAYVRSFSIRQPEPFLMRNAPTDLRLPGSLVNEGLAFDFYNGSSERSQTSQLQTLWYRQGMKPTAEKIGPSGRVLPTLNSAEAATNTWYPVEGRTPNGDNEMFRATGAVYLDLSNFDYAIRTTINSACRVYIGNTLDGQAPYINDWVDAGHTALTTTGAWLKAGSAGTAAPTGNTGRLANNASGWFPIVVEWLNGGGSGQFQMQLQRSSAVGTWENWTAIGNTYARWSPQGVYQANPRYDTHAEQIKSIASSFGLQFRVNPAALGNPNFPGLLEVAARVGRDTEVILSAEDLAGRAQAEIDASDVVDALIIDGSGLGDAQNRTGVTFEGISYVEASLHTFLHGDQLTLGDISSTPLLSQRAQSLQTLKSSAWEQVSAQPVGGRELVGGFPLNPSAAAATFDWRPGDGVRVVQERVGVVDASPRQIIGVQYPVRPGGRGAPTVKFRQRPRNIKQVVRDQFRQGALSRRNFQGQVVRYTSPQGGVPASAGGGVGFNDAICRTTLPANASDVLSMVLVVHNKGDAAVYGVSVNGTATGLTITQPGRYDLTSFVAKQNNTNPRLLVQMTPPAAPYGEANYQVEITAVLRS